MGTLVRYILLVTIKIFARLFYRFDVKWVGDPPQNFVGTKAGVVLNHTSLFEPLIMASLPNFILWKFARYGVLPGADITMSRPFAGRFFRLITKESVSITRKRDKSWGDFLSRINEKSLVMIAPEGRMKRPSGFDKDGKPMTVRSGIADIILILATGNMTLTYSGGLHHIHAPGDKFPRLFKTIKVRYESVNIAKYIKDLGGETDPREFRKRVVADLEARRDRYCD